MNDVKTPKKISSHMRQSALKELTMKELSSTFLIIGIFLFFISLFFNTFFTTGDDIKGYWVLVTGWLGFIIFQFAWFANPLNLLAVLLMKSRPVVALLLSVLAVIFASETFLFNEIPAVSGNEKIYIKEFGIGAYFWYIAQWLIMYSAVLNIIQKDISHQSEDSICDESAGYNAKNVTCE